MLTHSLRITPCIQRVVGISQQRSMPLMYRKHLDMSRCYKAQSSPDGVAHHSPASKSSLSRCLCFPQAVLSDWRLLLVVEPK